MKLKKVIIFIDGIQNPNAGTECQIIRLVRGLSERGVKVILISMTPSEFLENSDIPCDYHTLNVRKLLSFHTWCSVFFVAFRFRLRKFNVVHFFFNDSALVGPILFRVLGFKTITSRRDIGIWYTPLKLTWLRINRFFTTNYAVNSYAVKRYTCAKEGVNSNKVCVVYNGYDGCDDAFISTCVGFPFSKEHFVFGMVANLRPVKRPSDAIKAFSIVCSKHPEARLIFVGGHDSRDSLDFVKTVHDLGLSEKVYFAGTQQNASSWINRFDACLLCSESEGFSNSVIEYLQHAKPVICSDVGGNSEIIKHGENGFLYEKGCIPSLADWMMKLCGDPKLGERIGALAFDSVNNRFAVDDMVNNYISLYQDGKVRSDQ